MSAPKVSVLIPVFNGEPFLAECLDSVLRQDFSDMEILIVDDASTDGSAELARSYAAKDARIRWRRNPHNVGLARSFNRCLRKAKGEYIKYVLQDDKLLSPAAVRLLAAALDDQPAVTLAASASEVIDAESKVTTRRDHFEPGVTAGSQVIGQCLATGMNLIGEPSVVMFRRCQAPRGYDERLAQWLDLEMWFFLLERGYFAYLPTPLCAFRQHPRQQTEVNRQNGTAAREYRVLFGRWSLRQRFGGQVWRQTLFERLYQLRKHHHPELEEWRWDMMLALGPRWYATLWCKRKVTQPFQKLSKRLSRAKTGH